jgi:4-amino-4-deoxy-L-arabinose transferase-like glycosyltransferase
MPGALADRVRVLRETTLPRDEGQAESCRLRRALVGTLCVAAIPRLALIWWFPAAWSLDSPSYVRIAIDFATSLGSEDPRLGVLRLPGYPALLAVAFRITPRLEFALLLQALLGMAAACIAAHIGRQLGATPAVAIGLALFVALNPLYLVYEHSLMSESLAVFLVLASVDLALGVFGAASAGRGLAFGLAFGALLVTRPNAALLVVAALLAGVARRRHRKSERPSGKDVWATTALAIVLGLSIVIGPWLLRNHRALGRASLFASPQRTLLYYAIERELVPPAIDGVGDEQDKVRTFWALVDQGAAGEASAREIRLRAERVAPRTFAFERGRATLEFVGAGRRLPAAQIWLDRSLSVSADGRSPRERISRWADERRRVPPSVLLSGLRWALDAYAGPLQWALPCCFAAGCWLSIRRGAGASCSTVKAAVLWLALGYAGTAVVHGWSLASYERFAAPLDWAPVAFFLAGAEFSRRDRSKTKGRPASGAASPGQ